MKIVIVGCSGFVGTQLRSFFEVLGHQVIPLKVRTETSLEGITEVLEGSDIVINLAGLSIFGRWNKAYKQALYTSRIDTTHKLVQAMKSCKNRPKRFISTSAVGIYPNNVYCDEYQKELAEGFLAHICKDWEKEAFEANSLGVSTVVFRSGVVLAKNGGMLKKLYLPFLLGLGGKIGSGKQSLSWIHIDDLCQIYKKTMEDERIEGTYNLCAPESTTNIGFTKALGKVLNRPTVLPMPAWILNLVLAEGSSFILEGQNVYPKRLDEIGYIFKYNNIQKALRDCLL